MTKIGNLKTIVGPMYAGKTSKILQDILWLNHQNHKVLVLKPQIDDRYSKDSISTHDRLSFPCFSMRDWQNVLDHYNLKSYNYHTVFLDEIQFMCTKQTMEIVHQMLVDGVNVVAAGLNQDSRGQPFETTAMLMAVSDEITLLQSICTVCGKHATKTQRLEKKGDRVTVGSVGIYEPRCLKHWTPQ